MEAENGTDKKGFEYFAFISYSHKDIRIWNGIRKLLLKAMPLHKIISVIYTSMVSVSPKAKTKPSSTSLKPPSKATRVPKPNWKSYPVSMLWTFGAFLIKFSCTSAC